MNEKTRIVSLIASATEVICSLGLEDALVGISHECDYPASITNRPRLSEPQLDPTASSAEIDDKVRSIVQSGLSVYTIDEKILASLEPTLIITQNHCEVCAVSQKDVERATRAITGINTNVCTLHPNTLEDVYRDIRTVAQHAQIPSKGDDLVTEMQARLLRLEERSSASSSRPTIACVEWLMPAMVAGGWMPALVQKAGGQPVLVHEGDAFQTVDWERILASDPEVLVLMPCGFPVQQTLKELATDSALRERLAPLKAVQNNRAFVVDGNAYFNRPGPRLVDSAEILASLLHPKIFKEFRQQYQESIVCLNDAL